MVINQLMVCVYVHIIYASDVVEASYLLHFHLLHKKSLIG